MQIATAGQFYLRMPLVCDGFCTCQMWVVELALIEMVWWSINARSGGIYQSTEPKDVILSYKLTKGEDSYLC